MTGMQDASELRSGFTSDRSFLDVITPPDPAAGVNLAVTLGTQRWVVVRSVIVTLTTDANAANRFVSVDYLLGQRFTLMRNAATVLVTANTSAQVFQFDNQHAVSEWNTGTPVFAPLTPLPLQAGWGVAVNVDNIQAGDQLSSCKLLVERFYPPHVRADDDLG